MKRYSRKELSDAIKSSVLCIGIISPCGLVLDRPSSSAKSYEQQLQFEYIKVFTSDYQFESWDFRFMVLSYPDILFLKIIHDHLTILHRNHFYRHLTVLERL